MKLLAFAGLVCVTIIFVRGSIFERVRKRWPSFLSCALCVGFWVGLAGTLYIQPNVWWLEHFLSACIVSVASFALYLALLRLEGE